MKSIIVSIAAAVLVVGYGNPDGALLDAAFEVNIEAVKKAFADGANVNAKSDDD